MSSCSSSPRAGSSRRPRERRRRRRRSLRATARCCGLCGTARRPSPSRPRRRGPTCRPPGVTSIFRPAISGTRRSAIRACRLARDARAPGGVGHRSHARQRHDLLLPRVVRTLTKPGPRPSSSPSIDPRVAEHDPGARAEGRMETRATFPGHRPTRRSSRGRVQPVAHSCRRHGRGAERCPEHRSLRGGPATGLVSASATHSGTPEVADPRSGSGGGQLAPAACSLGRKRSSCYCSDGTCRPRTREDRDRRPQVERLRDRDVRPQRRPPPRAVRPRDHVPPLLQPGRRADAARPRGELRPGGGRLGPLRPARAPLDPAQAAPPRGGPPPRAPLRPAAPVHGAVGGDDPRLHPPPLPAVPAQPDGLPLRALHDGRRRPPQRPRLHRLRGLARRHPALLPRDRPREGARRPERDRRGAAAGPRAGRRWSACGSATSCAAGSCSSRAT